MIDRTSGRQHVAWDIETTGFAWNDSITVAGFWFPPGCVELIANTSSSDSGCSVAAYESHLEDVSSGISISVTPVVDEAELVAAMGRVIFEKFERDYDRLVAFNAESWKGGFDLPFLRTRCLTHGHDWLFDGIEFSDLWEPVQKRLNTTYTVHGTQADVNSLTGAHATLFDQTPSLALDIDESEHHPWYHESPYDPFDDSGSAVTCYQRGDLEPVLQHNLADIHRTWELGELVRAFVPAKDITTKKL